MKSLLAACLLLAPLATLHAADGGAATGESSASATAPPENSVSTNDPRIWKGGRWIAADGGAMSAQWAASYVRVRFTGTRFALDLATPCQLEIALDQRLQPSINGAAGVVEVATNISSGEHEICVAFSKDWINSGPVVLKGIRLDADGKLLPPRAKPLIEFIGDSITAGGFHCYAWLAAEQLGAEHIQIAIPGIGLLDGRPNFVSPTTGMAWQYFKTTSDLSRRDVPDWDFSDKPDLIVINLGTNDDGKGAKDEEFGVGLADFIRKVRVKRPGAPIVVVEPFGIFRQVGSERVWLRFLDKGIEGAVKQLNHEGDANVFVCSTAGWFSTETAGPLVHDHVHPNGKGGELLGAKLSEALKPYLPAPK